MPVNIRTAQADDAAAIVTVLRDLDWYPSMSGVPFETAVATVAQNLALCFADDSHHVYIAEIDGMIQGYAAVHFVPYLLIAGPEGYVSELFVSTAARGQGIGTLLLNTIEVEARARGCSRLGLLNSKTRESYQRSFYAKQGWEAREQFVNFIRKLD